jgi:hypothetical protein
MLAMGGIVWFAGKMGRDESSNAPERSLMMGCHQAGRQEEADEQVLEIALGKAGGAAQEDRGDSPTVTSGSRRRGRPRRALDGRAAVFAAIKPLICRGKTRGRFRAAALTPRLMLPQIGQARICVDGRWTSHRKRLARQTAYLQGKTMARAGIEPATPRFSVVCSTN